MVRFFLLLALCAAPLLADSAIVPGVGAGGIRLGQTEDQLRQVLGAPREVRPSASDPAFRMAFYEGLMVMLNKERKVIGITLSASGWKTAEGVGVGTSSSEVERCYGAALRRGEGNWNYPGKGLGFSFDGQGKASHVYVFKPEGERPLLGDRLIVPGQRVGQLRLGAPASAIQAAWGAPSKTQDLGGGRSLWTYQEQGVRLMVAAGSVDAILVTTGDFITREGLKIGASEADIKQNHGSGFTRKGPGLFYPEKGIGFLLGKEAVIEIQVLFPR